MRLLRRPEHDGFARSGEPVGEILPGAKSAALAGDHQRAATFVGSRRIERRAQGLKHRLVAGVEPLRPVQRDHTVAGKVFDEDGLRACGELLVHGVFGGLSRRSSVATSFFSLAKSSAMRV